MADRGKIFHRSVSRDAEDLIDRTHRWLKSGINHPQDDLRYQQPLTSLGQDRYMSADERHRFVQRGKKVFLIGEGEEKELVGKRIRHDRNTGVPRLITNYEKSFLWRYFKDKHRQHFPGWEKAAIKQGIQYHDQENKDKLFRDRLKRNAFQREQRILVNRGYEGEGPPWFIRALLGLAEHYEFEMWKDRDYQRSADNMRRMGRPFNVPPPVGHDKIKVKVKPPGEIEQFPSHLQFKIFDGFVCLYPRPLPPELFQKRTYEFSAVVTYTDKDRLPDTVHLSGDDDDSLKLQLPRQEDFDLVEFLEYPLPGEGVSHL